MSKRGRAKPALATAALGSFVAGTIGLILLTFLAEPVADLAVKLQPADYFALVVLAFVAVTSLIGRSVIRGLLSLALGLAIGLIGIDQLTGQARLTFGVDQLFAGVDIVIVAVGLFAIGEALHMASRKGHDEEMTGVSGAAWFSRDDLRRSWKPWLRGTAFGFPFGAMPTGGAEIPTFLSYATERRLAKGTAKEEFGRGRDRGGRRPGGGEQRRVHGRARAAADDRHPDVGHRGDPARLVPDLRPAARARSCSRTSPTSCGR